MVIVLMIGHRDFAQKALSSQNKKALKLYEKGQKKSKERDFESALAFFGNAIKSDPNFYEAFLRRGSLFHAMGMEDSVYANLNKYLTLTSTPNPTILNRMASMAFKRGQYSLSDQYLGQLFEIIPETKKDRELALIDRSIDFALDEIQKDPNLDIVLLPDQVNKFSLQYLPSITIDNSTLIYTKRDFIQGDEDIVVSHYKGGKWTEAQSVSNRINSPLNEGASTISADGRLMIFTSCDKRDSYGSCDLYFSKKTGENWSKPKNLGPSINSQYWESQPSLSADGNKIYFSSNRPGGRGGRDLWVSNFVKGKWSKPENLGNSINSFKDETTPFIHPNGETIYFSSNGFIGMGGFDLMKSTFEDSVWTTPQNLGFPINSFKDEVGLLIGGDGKTAFFAKEEQRDGRIIDSKIVTFSMPVVHQAKPATYIVGKVFDYATGAPLRASIEIVDLLKNQMLYQAKSDSLSGNYTMVLPADKELVCYVKKKGYLFYENNFFSESNSMLSPDTVNIRLKAISVDEFIVLRNIYFEVNSYELDGKSLT
jgi:tetratricopeptide (TPR) repeat protein